MSGGLNGLLLNGLPLLQAAHLQYSRQAQAAPQALHPRTTWLLSASNHTFMLWPGQPGPMVVGVR
jgi:hypothetical protein